MAIYILDNYYLGITALITIGWQLAFFAVAWSFKFDKVTDFAGGTNFVFLAALTFGLEGTYYVRQIIASAFVWIWGLRLSLFLLNRIIRTGKDDRFDGRREDFFSFLGFWIFQMIWVFVVSLPVTFLNSPRLSLPELGGGDVMFGSALDILGVIFFVVGLSTETIADQMKFNFRSKRKSPSDFIHSGVWGWSRHPNYFGEILLWSGIFLLSLDPAIYYNSYIPVVGILSPLFTACILLFLSGLPLSERPTAQKQWEKGNWEAYSAYLAQTSPLIPLPPAIYRRLPLWVKRVFLFELPLYQFIPESNTPNRVDEHRTLVQEERV